MYDGKRAGGVEKLGLGVVLTFRGGCCVFVLLLGLLCLGCIVLCFFSINCYFFKFP